MSIKYLFIGMGTWSLISIPMHLSTENYLGLKLMIILVGVSIVGLITIFIIKKHLTNK